MLNIEEFLEQNRDKYKELDTDEFDVSEMVLRISQEEKKKIQEIKDKNPDFSLSNLTDEEIDPKENLEITREFLKATTDSTLNMVKEIFDCALNKKNFDGFKLGAAMIPTFQRLVRSFNDLNLFMQLRHQLGDANIVQGRMPLYTDQALFKFMENAFFAEYNNVMDYHDLNENYLNYEEID